MIRDPARAQACASVLNRLAAGAISPEVAMMELLIATEDERWVADLVRTAGFEALSRLLTDNADGCARIAAMLRADVDVPPQHAILEEGIAFCRTLFDWSVQQSEESSVALYSLGNPEVLATATREIVEVLRGFGVLGKARDLLDLGCGIGRMERALAASVRAVHGIDVSEKMIAAARRRCAGIDNVTLATCSGLDLAPLETASFDVVLAVDSVPYLVQTGMPLVDAHFAEAARVLRCGGDLVILGFSYRDDHEADRRDAIELGRKHGFTPRALGTSPFTLWNARAYHWSRTG